MATIALYSNQIAQMSGKLGEVKKTVGDYKSELFSLKTKALAIKQSICNMEDVISSIQASTSVQEEKVDALEQVRANSEQFIEDTYRIDGNVADLVNKRKDDFYDQYKYLKPDREKNFWEKRKDDLKKIGEWCKEHWKAVVTIVLVIAVIVVAVVATVMFGLPAVLAFIGKSILCGIVKSILSGIVIGGVIGGLISIATGGGFWEGFEEGAFFGAVAGGIASGMGVFFTGAVKGAVIKLWQTLVTGGASGVGAMLLSDLGDVVIKGDSMSLKKIVTDVVIAGVTGVVFAGIGYGLSKAFKALKLKMFNKGGSGTSKGSSNATKGSGKSLYDSNGNYTGGRNQAELDTLARDPAHAGSTRQYDIDQGILEQKIGLSLEESGKVSGPLTRDPSGAAEFFDSTGQAWDVKSFNSNYKPSKGGYTLQKSMDSILDSLGKNENVMLDTSNLSLAHKTELLNELSKQGLMDKVILWP